MRDFQRSMMSEAQIMGAEYGLSLTFTTVEVLPCAAVGHEVGDVYLHSVFAPGCRAFELFLYTDEAGVAVDERHYSFELADYRHDESRLRAALFEFLRRCLEGTPAPQAIRQCRREHR